MYSYFVQVEMHCTVLGDVEGHCAAIASVFCTVQR